MDIKSNGNINLNPTNIYHHPIITPNYLVAESDKYDLLQSGNELLDEVKCELISKFQKKYSFEYFIQIINDMIWKIFDFISRAHHIGAIWHNAGSCQINSVVDDELKVYNIEKLRICDMSVVKKMPNALPQSVAHVIGYNLADIIFSKNDTK